MASGGELWNRGHENFRVCVNNCARRNMQEKLVCKGDRTGSRRIINIKTDKRERERVRKENRFRWRERGKIEDKSRWRAKWNRRQVKSAKHSQESYRWLRQRQVKSACHSLVDVSTIESRVCLQPPDSVIDSQRFDLRRRTRGHLVLCFLSGHSPVVATVLTRQVVSVPSCSLLPWIGLVSAQIISC